MAGLSNYAENALLNHLLRGGVAPLTPPASVWMGLFLTDPGESGAGQEVSGNNYSRSQISFGAPVDGVCLNDQVVTFPTPSLAWGDVTHTGLFDAQASGNLLFYGQLSQTKTIGAGTVLRYLVGAVSATLS